MSIPFAECDSPIEDIFLWDFRKIADVHTRLRRQVNCDTDRGRFRLDFVLESIADDYKIGIECDGRDYHSVEVDCQRDAAIIRSHAVDKIYRLRGGDLFYVTSDTLHLLSLLEPKFFSAGGLRNIEVLATPDYMRKDKIGRSGYGFPFAAVRSYGFFLESTPEELHEQILEHDWHQDIAKRPPTHISWTA